VVVARGLAEGLGLGGDALDVGAGDEPAEAVAVVHDEDLVDADVGGEEFVGLADGVGGHAFLGHGAELGTGRHDLANAFRAVALADDVAGEEADEDALVVHHGEGAELEPALLDHAEDVGDGEVGRDGDGVLDEAVDVVLDAGDLLDLVGGGEVAMDEAEAAVERHGDGHARLGDGVHVGRDDGDLEPEGGGEGGGEVGVLREDLAVEGGEGDVVVGERGRQAGGEEAVGREVEGVVGGGAGGRGGASLLGGGGAGGGNGFLHGVAMSGIVRRAASSTQFCRGGVT